MGRETGYSQDSMLESDAVPTDVSVAGIARRRCCLNGGGE